MRNLLTILFVCMIIQLQAITREVAIDGTKPYISIQTAIEESNNGDVIQVYPGTYRENINFNQHNVTLQSLYAVTPDTSYITNTHIIGLHTQPAIIVLDSTSVEINGFTIMNNEFNSLEAINYGGGGICVYNSRAIIKNNIITKCLIEQYGGGICIGADPLRYSYAYLENNTIFNCKSYTNGGGIAIYRCSEVIFSEVNRNSVYDNYAAYGKDIAVIMATYDMHIYLKKGSINMTEPDQFFVIEFYPLPYPDIDVTLDIDQTVNLPLTEHDLYVAPWGNDANTGLNLENPLKTIDYATRIIKPSPDNPKYIYLAEGVYSRTLNQQEYPFVLKPWTNLIGSGMYNTIIDDENTYLALSATVFPADIELRDFSVIHSGNWSNPGEVIGVNGRNVIVSNLLLENNNMTQTNGIASNFSKNQIMRNIIVRNCSTDTGSDPLNMYYVDNLIVENFVVDNLHTTNPYGGSVTYELQYPNKLLMNNCSITNCSAFDPWIFHLTNHESALENPPNGLCVINNMLIANNNTSAGDWDLAKIIIHDDYNRVIFNNWTIANNRGSSTMMGILGLGCTINNMILYNPEVSNEIELGSIETPNIPLWINNSLIYQGFNRIKLHNNSEFLHVSNLLDRQPQFAGESSDSLNMSMPDYYRLSPHSLCINGGVRDTTGTYINQVDYAGNQRIWDNIIDMGCFEYGAPVAVNDAELPAINDYNLKNYPNPIYLSDFHYTTISFDYPAKAKSEPEIEIFNIKGQKVRTLKTGESFLDLAKKVNLSKEAMSNIHSRNYAAIWDARNESREKVASGIYLYRAKVNGRILQTKKMLVLK